MIHDDRIALMNELDAKWPDKFTQADMEYWTRELDRFHLADVLEVLASYKAANTFRPKIQDIKERLRARLSSTSSSTSQPNPLDQYKSFYGREIAKKNPALVGRLERELLLRHFRFEFFARRKSLLERLQGTKIPAPVDVQEAAVNQLRQNTVRLCVRDLCAAGEPSEDAARWAAWIDADQAEFDAVLNGTFEHAFV